MKEGKEGEERKTIPCINHISPFQQLRAAETGMTYTPPRTGEYYMPLTPSYENLIFN